MSIETRKPREEFYEQIDICIPLYGKLVQLREKAAPIREQFKTAFYNAIEIDREDGFTNFQINEHIRDYVWDKIPDNIKYSKY